MRNDQLPSSLVIPAGTDYPEAPTLCAASLSDASTKGAVPPSGHAQSEVGKGRHINNDPPLTESRRAEMIEHARFLYDFFRAEQDAHEAFWLRDGCFSHKGQADRAGRNASEVERLWKSLVRGSKA